MSNKKKITETDPWSILGVSANANENEIKRAYRNLVKKYHPDKNKSPDAAERFRKIQTAYESIMKTSHQLEIIKLAEQSTNTNVIVQERINQQIDEIRKRMDKLFEELKIQQEKAEVEQKEQEELTIKKLKSQERESMRIMYG